MEGEFSLANKTGARLPALPLADLKNDILGINYSLSVAFVEEKESREINKKCRGKDRPTNILSFYLHKDVGEIILCPPVVRREAKSFGKTFSGFLGFLVIHGMLHLKGMRHGSKMEKAEHEYDQKYFGRNRRGLIHDPGRGRRIFKGRKKS